MGTLLVAAIVLAVVSAIFELKLMKEVPLLQKLTARFGAFGLIMSMALSMFVGIIFGAAGLTAMIAGVMSTVMTQPYHTWKNKQANMAAENKQKMSDKVEEYKATYRPVFKAIKITLIVLTSPIWIPVRVRRWWINNVSHTSTKPSDYATAA